MSKRRLDHVHECPRADELHTPSPSEYLAWHEWAERMSKTHVQQRCPACERWSIWVPKTEANT